MGEQAFTQTQSKQWLNLEKFPGTQLLPLAKPVSEGSIHLLRIKKGAEIPIHTHPCDEYVYVLNGMIKTGEKTCTPGMFWYTPASYSTRTSYRDQRCGTYDHSLG